MEVATVLVWVLRVVLPIVLFWIYFKLQLPKDGEPVYTGSTKNQYARQKLLDYRQGGFDDGPPAAMENVRLVTEAQAPALFASKERRGGGRNNKDSNKEDRLPKEKRERKGADKAAAKDDDRDGAADAVADAPPAEGGSDDKMHLESLLNYVAFNRKEQQRTFIVDESGAPPPPPPPPKKPAAAAPPAPETTGSNAEKTTAAPADASVTPLAMEKANAEAQMVLKGAIEFQRADVVRDLYEQLVDSQVEISEATFTLMIKASTLAEDLKTASDLLAKMEASGHCPDSELLDKVMDLYSTHKKKGAQKPATTSPSKGGVTPLSSGAQMFQPCAETFSIAFNESAVLSELNQCDELARAKLSSDAPVFVPNIVGVALNAPPPPPPNEDMKQQRTALCAKADSFQPQGLVSFDPQAYTWTVAGTDEEANEEGKGRKGKSQNEGKGGKGGRAEKGARSNYTKGGEQQGGKSSGKAGKGDGRGKADHAKTKAPDEKVDHAKGKDIDASKKWQPKEAGAHVPKEVPPRVAKEVPPKATKWQPKAAA